MLRVGVAALSGGATLALAVSGSAAGSTSRHVTWHLKYRTDFHTWTQLEDIAATGPRDAWAVGYTDSNGFVLQWNGRAWRPMSSFPGHLMPVQTVAASGPTDVWVFADGAGGIWEALRWNGSSWHAIQMPAGIGGRGSAAVTSPSDVWFSDGQDLAHWNGSDWSVSRTSSWVTVAAIPGGQVLAVEGGRFGGQAGRLVAHRWNGREWAWVNLPHPAFHGGTFISVQSARNIAIEVASVVPRRGLVLQWNGHSWRSIHIPGWAYDFSSVAAIGRDSVWVGPDARWNGHTWNEFGPLDPEGYPYLMAGVPGSTATWLAASGVAGQGSAPYRGFIWLSGRL